MAEGKKGTPVHIKQGYIPPQMKKIPTLGATEKKGFTTPMMVQVPNPTQAASGDSGGKSSPKSE